MPNESILAAAEDVLRTAWGGDVALEPGDQGGLGGRTHVHRVTVRAAPAGAPPSVVVKRPRLRDGETFDPSADAPPAAMFFTEWACLQLLTELTGAGAEPPAPRLYGGDARRGLLVIEDLGAGDGLHDALLGDDAARATAMLVGLLETLGRMHAITHGRRDRFEAMLGALGRTRPSRDDGARRRREAAMRAALDRLGLSPHARFFDEVAAIDDRTESAALRTLLHGDPCPDNCRAAGGRVRLLDFEHGRFGDAFADGCYPRIHFPTCWCVGRLPDDVARLAADAYRRELARGVPVAADEERFERGMLDASVVWAWGTFAGWHMPEALERDHEWGLVTVRQRILFRFRLLLPLLERRGDDPGVADTTRRCLEALAARWGDVPDVPLYPAFR